MNTVVLVGYVGRDPEKVEIKGDKTLAKLSLATDRYGDGTDWHTVKVWGKSGDFVLKYVKKGSLVCVTGRVEYSSSEKDGVKRWFTDIVADRVKLYGGGKEADEPDENGDLPF